MVQREILEISRRSLPKIIRLLYVTLYIRYMWIPMLWQDVAGTYDPKTETWSDVIYMPCTKETNFAPELPKETPDIIYLCFPNNPTGSTITKDQLQEWVDYANKVGRSHYLRCGI